MRILDKRSRLSRRQILQACAATFVTVKVASSGVVIGDSWAAAPASLKPETFATLVQMSRDIYPHDRFGDPLYAKAVDGLDTAAESDAELLKLLEEGVIGLDSAAKSEHGNAYNAVAWEIDRVKLLRDIQDDAFFQKVRGHLVSGLYNQKEAWALLGYEGESASKGGYIERVFADIDWLPERVH